MCCARWVKESEFCPQGRVYDSIRRVESSMGYTKLWQRTNTHTNFQEHAARYNRVFFEICHKPPLVLSANQRPDGPLTTLPWSFTVIHTTIVIINPKYWTAKTIPYRTDQHENRCYGVLISASQWSKTEVRRCSIWQSWVSAIVFPMPNGKWISF